jgi:hypothetical protein
MPRRPYAVTFEISSEGEQQELMTYVRLIKKHKIPYELGDADEDTIALWTKKLGYGPVAKPRPNKGAGGRKT